MTTLYIREWPNGARSVHDEPTEGATAYVPESEVASLARIVDEMTGALLDGKCDWYSMNAVLTIAGFPDHASRNAELKRRAGR